MDIFFVASKLGWFFLTPSNIILIFLVIALILGLVGRRKLATGAVAFTAIVYLGIGIGPLGPIVMHPLEDRFPPCDPAPPITGIIVLGGALDTKGSVSRGSIELNEAAERLTYAVELIRLHPGAKLYFTGGEGLLMPSGVSEADFSKELLLKLGVPEDRLVIETASRNTSENARMLRPLIDQKPGQRWVLLTSAFHMPRSMGVFRHEGYRLEACPVDYRNPKGSGIDDWESASASGLRIADTAVREWIGLVVYRIAGLSDALFPGP